VIDLASLRATRHDPPEGWSAETFERVTDALAAALIAAVRRVEQREERARAALGSEPA
jgi:hypothetical protein